MEKQRAKMIDIARHRLSTGGDGVTTLVAFHGCQLGGSSLAGKAIALAVISAGLIHISGCHCTSSNNKFTELDEESLRVVTTLPKFYPAIVNVKVVEYWFILPITFRLGDDLKNHEITESSVIIATNSKTNDDITTNFEENKIYQAVEQMPEYPGGQASLLKFIGDNL